MLQLMHEHRPAERAFTLIELLVVMIIIAILMAIAVPTFLAQKNNAQKTKALANIKTIVNAAETCTANSTDGVVGPCAYYSTLRNYEKGIAQLPTPTTGGIGQYDIDAIENDVLIPGRSMTAQGYMVWTSIKDGDHDIWFAEIHREDGSLLKWCGKGIGLTARNFAPSSATPPSGVSGSRTCTTGTWG